MTDDATDAFDWNPLGVAWWDKTARELGASDKQAKFAAAVDRGCSNTQAYREAGYTATNEAGHRTGGYRLRRSNIVERLLAFAAAEASGKGHDNTVNKDEAKRILSSLARGSDPRVRISAVEQLAKMDDRDRDLGQTQELDGLQEDRMIRTLLQRPGGAAAAVCLQMGKSVAISRIALLHDVHMGCMADPVSRVIWDIAVMKCSPNMQRDLRELLARPDWQRETRELLWREVDVDPDKPDKTIPIDWSHEWVPQLKNQNAEPSIPTATNSQTQH